MSALHQLVDRTKFTLHPASYSIHPDFRRVMNEDYPGDLNVKFIGPFYKPLENTTFASDPTVARILKEAHDTLNDPKLEDILKQKRSVPGTEYLLNLQNFAKFILALLAEKGGLTPQMVKDVELDPLLIDWANYERRNAPIVGEDVVMMGNPNAAGGNPQTPLSRSTILHDPKGNGKEARLFIRMAALVIRSLKVYIRRANDGQTEGWFTITPLKLQANVLQWAKAWAEWCPPTDGRK